MYEFFQREIVQPIFADSRTNNANDRFLGFPFQRVRRRVVQSGLADFTRPHLDPEFGELTANDVVKLYCFMNMRQHFFASLNVLRAYSDHINLLFDGDQPPLVIDFGCGPATVALALAEALEQPELDYLGIDNAPAMRRKGASIFRRARLNRLIHVNSMAEFVSNWNEFDVAYLRGPRRVLLNFSYFYASRSLGPRDIRDLSQFISCIKAKNYVEGMLLLYTNSTNPMAGQNYRRFRTERGWRTQPGERRIEYFQRMQDASPKRIDVAYHMVRLKGIR